jgi:uncharacterized protein YkwD
LRKISPLLTTITLAACGGGGSEEPGQSDMLLSTTSQSEEVAATQTAELEAAASVTPILLAAAGTSTAGTQLDATKTCGLANFQQEIMNRVNQARASSRMCGSTFYNATTTLKWNTNLFNAAAGHSADMAKNNYFSHTSLDGRNAGQRITAAGYKWRAYGENIAAGQSTAEIVVNGWLNSPGHCANIMRSNYTEIGVSCVKGTNARYKTYWTMDLARP